MRALKTSFISIRRSPYQSLASILLVVVTAIVFFSLSFVMSGTQLVLHHYETQPQVIAFLRLDSNPEAISALEGTMKQKTYVRDVTLTTQDEALEIYKREYADSPRLLELVTAQMLPASLEINALTLTDLPRIKEDLSSDPAVDEVILQEDVIETFSKITNFVRTIGFIFAGLMIVLSFLIITIVISMKMQGHKATISILRLLGATKSYVRSPYTVEGMIYGFVGGLLGWGVVFLLVLYFAPTVQAFIPEVRFYPLSLTFILYQLAIGVGACMLIGMMAGQAAASRMIKKI